MTTTPLGQTTPQTPNSLTAFAQGSKWVVDAYYHQILGANEEAAPLAETRAAPYQQYQKIMNLELNVTQALTGTQVQDTAEYIVTGTASFYGFMQPIWGDMFIADIGDGKKALLTVTSVQKATYRSQSNYLITYQVQNYLSPTSQQALESKVVAGQVYQFSRALLTQGQYPLMTTDTYATYQGLNDTYNNLVTMYTHDFMSNQRQTLLVPDQYVETYDHWLTHAFVNIVQTDQSMDVLTARMASVMGDLAMKNTTIWDALTRVNAPLLGLGIQQAKVISTAYFKNYPNLTGIFYTGIGRIVYPMDTRTDVDAYYDKPLLPMYQKFDNDGKLRYMSLERALRDKDGAFFSSQCACSDVDVTPQLPDIVPVTVDDYYVFSAGFYGVRGASMLSRLEVLASDAMNGKGIDLTTLSDLSVKAFSWPNLERFYYIPVILTLIRMATSSNSAT